MSVETTTRKEAAQEMTSLITEFTFSFRALVNAPSDIKCIRTTTGTGEDEDMIYVADLPEDPTEDDVLKYTVTVNDDGIGGTVEVAYASTSCTITIYRETTDTQGSAYEDYNQFPASTVESDFDRRTMVSQEISENSNRALRLPITSSAEAELPTPEADTFLGWDADTVLANRKLSDISAVERASEAEAEAGTSNTTYMTPYRTNQAIDALGLTPADIDTSGTLGTSDVKVPSQNAVKTYVDALDYVTGPDSATDSTIALFNGTGGSLIADSTVTISTDGTLSADSDVKIPTEKAVKTYADSLSTDVYRFKEKTESVTEQTNVSGSYPTYAAASTSTTFLCPSDASNIYMSLEIGSMNASETTYVKLDVNGSTTDATVETVVGTTYKRVIVSIPYQAGWADSIVTITPQLANNYGANRGKIYNNANIYVWVD